MEEGTSYKWGKKEIKEYICNNYKGEVEILDVGAGMGTYYELLKDNYKKIDGVEVFRPNVERYRLERKYRKVYCIDIRNFKYVYYDLVIFGDILEHLEVKEAQEVLKYALEHSRSVIVAVPYCYVQGEVEGNVYEIHKQDDLTKENVKERYPELELLIGDERYGYYVGRKEVK